MAPEYRTALEALEARLEEAEARAAAFAADAERVQALLTKRPPRYADLEARVVAASQDATRLEAALAEKKVELKLANAVLKRTQKEAEELRTELATAKEALEEIQGPGGNPEGLTIPELAQKIEELSNALEEAAAQPGTFLGVDFADLSEYLPYPGPSLQDVESFKEAVRAWAKAEGHHRLALEVR